MTERLIGRVIRISRSGWGFIASKDIQFTRIFFHWTELRGDSIPFLEVRIGMKAEFTPIQIPDKGWRAVNVKISEKERHYEADTTDSMPSLQE